MNNRIHIFEGDEGSLREHASAWATRESQPIFLDCELDPRQSWRGVRQILNQCVHWLGEERVSEVLDHHAESASLVLDPWKPSSSEIEVGDGARVSARLESHLTHNWVVQRPLISGWARLLSDLAQQADLCLVVSYVNFLDWESLATLKTLVSSGRENYPKLCRRL